jgi:hypothetical protein
LAATPQPHIVTETDAECEAKRLALEAKQKAALEVEKARLTEPCSLTIS